MTSDAVFSPAKSVDLLRRTPALLDAWLRGLAPAWLHADEGPDTFSPFEVVGHLVHGERADWIPRARHIAEGREGPFESFDRFAHRTEFVGQPIEALLDAFAAARRHSLDVLAEMDLSEVELDRTGEHPALGEVTLRQLLATWVVHDQGHVAQIARVLAKRYVAQVGPWREYLPVLDDRRAPSGDDD